jgi:hypothetical protein
MTAFLNPDVEEHICIQVPKVLRFQKSWKNKLPACSSQEPGNQKEEGS